MKILIILRDTSLNGITTYNRVLANTLTRSGHQVAVWPPLGWPSWASRLFGVFLHRFFEPLLRPWVAAFAPDILFVSHYSQAKLANRLHRTLGCAWFACMHNGRSPKRMAQWQQQLQNASGVVTLCQSMYHLYSPWVVLSPTHRLPLHENRLLLPAPAHSPQPRPAAPIVLTYCARLSGQKGPRCADWLQAIKNLPQASTYSIRVIGGGRYLPKLRQLAKDLQLNVTFYGLVDNPAPLLATSHVITGAGYALIEGIISGCVGVGLGFGGCFGVINLERTQQALNNNFGDHSPTPFPHPIPPPPRHHRPAFTTGHWFNRNSRSNSRHSSVSAGFSAGKQCGSLGGVFSR